MRLCFGIDKGHHQPSPCPLTLSVSSNHSRVFGF
ncbi:hypothetical protein SNOG_20143 [Parastagonospora nodorum SN15]|uniref:Uncharacterized protein n=1 Tax=Phaeosphaeria nodorum (strain SN15 / ATCC MYA-4574 / FGSC 10173) TaxID=321614 RepID=A9JXE0_PHANO|nr:hypothetical protein SNOG_20143 [Parastagonospora nodorum SN15]EDP89829.1 hypothetical protein SNOG_20143 [Parastagonospora nodorum SN15]